MIRSKLSIRKGFVLFSVSLLTVVLFGSAALAQKVRLRSQISPNCGSSSNLKYADIFADGNIAVQGSYNCRGAFIYDITNPDAPVLASWYNPGATTTDKIQFLEAIVVGNRGYFGSGGTSGGNVGGVHIVDLTNPYSPVLLGTVDSTHGGGHNIVHEMMVIDQAGSRYLIENFNSTGTLPVRVIDITNPAVPVFKWAFNASDNGWIHAMHVRGNRLYTSEFTGANVGIYDISNLATQAPALLGNIVSNTTNHSSWTSEDGRYLYSCRETFDGDLRVYDVQNPATPVLLRSIKAGDLGINAITPHNPVVMGNFLYVAWYQAGIQVFDLTDPTFPKRVGQYDTFAPAFAPTDEQRQAFENLEPWDVVCGLPSGLKSNALPNSYDGNWAVYPFLGQNKVLAGDLANGLLILDASAVTSPVKNVVSDFDGDRKTDLSVYTPGSGDWQIEQTSDGASSTTHYGATGDIIVPGDYDGDGKSDVAVFRPSTGYWYLKRSTAGEAIVQFGSTGDIPVAADYDADGKTDIAVWRPSNGAWYIAQSTLGLKVYLWGTNGDKPMVGDYEGDGKVDITVWRPSNGVWYVFQTSSSIAKFAAFGMTGDKPLDVDFDGNGVSDYAVYRPSTGTWYAVDAVTNAFRAYNFGIAEDNPVPADYDGDGKADLVVYRPSTNVWYSLSSLTGTYTARVFGQTGDRPSPSSVQPQ